MKEEILNIKDLTVRFYTYEGIVKAIEQVSLFMRKGETLGIVGETGCGKSVTSLSIMAIVPPPGKIEGGEVLFKGKGGTVDILKLDERSLQKIRGSEISIIFQEPSIYLNPVFTVGDQICEAILLHRREDLCKRALNRIKLELQNVNKRGSLKALVLKFERALYERMLREPDSNLLKVISKVPLLRRYKNRLKEEARKEAIKSLREMEIADPERVIDMYPHELSGGMRQRVMIAMALACNPILLIADEPTTNLDVTIQAQILDLIRRLKKKYNMSVLFITHDLGVVAEMCDRVAVMYAGGVCEIADVVELFKNPLHPYTKALLESIPRPNKEFKPIKGHVPNLIDPPPGCRFHPRCEHAMEICSKIRPTLAEVKKEHFVACHLYGRGG